MSDNAQFKDKVVLVTGAGHGIGRAVAERFANDGAHVVVNDLLEDRARDVAAALPNGRGFSICADVSSTPAVDAMFDQLLARYGTIDILVNNAGDIHAGRHFLEADEAWWDRIIGINLKGTFLCSLRAAHVMARRRAGSIVNMSSGGATRAHRGYVAYDASKGGIEGMTRAMALDLAPYGVRVNAVVPGLIQTYDLSEAEAVERGKVVPMDRLGTPEDVAGVAAFLCTDDARYVTGACYVVDGGVLVQQRSAPVDTFPLSRFPTIDRLPN